MTAWERFVEDYRRYLPDTAQKSLRWRVRHFGRNEPLWALAVFRFGQYLREEANPVTRRMLRVPFAVAHRFVRLALGIHLFPQSRIGPGLYIGHWGGIWISPFAVIGSYCNINHETTIGTVGERGAPVLEDRVWVGPKSTVTGPVRVGAGAVVGANSLVVSNVPENAVVVGVPAKVVSRSGSASLLEPRNRDVDRELGRTTALQGR